MASVVVPQQLPTNNMNIDELLRKSFRERYGAKWGLHYGNALRHHQAIQRRLGYTDNNRAMQMLYAEFNNPVTESDGLDLDINTAVNFQVYEDVSRLSAFAESWTEVRMWLNQYQNGHITRKELFDNIAEFKKFGRYARTPNKPGSP